MIDTVELEASLRRYRPEGVELAQRLPDPFIWPRYDGYSVGNIGPTALRAMGAATFSGMLPPLKAELLGDLTEGVQRVVLLIVDALGWEQLQRVLKRHPESFINRATQEGKARLLPLTTTFPSTTNSVLTTIWTARPPLQHGMLAFTMFLREWMMVAECISCSTIHRPFGQVLMEYGFDPRHFLPVPSLGETLSVQGFLAYAAIYHQYTHTPLSEMHFRGTREVRGHVSAAEMWTNMRHLLEEHAGEKFLLGGYWHAVDNLAHRYGPLDESGEMETITLDWMLERIFLEPMSRQAREGTLFLLTADHGQIDTPPKEAIYLDDHPALKEMLLMPPIGERRVPFFYVRAGQERAVRDYVEAHLADRFFFLTREELMESGLLGPGKPYVETPHRLGDLIGVALGGAYFERERPPEEEEEDEEHTRRLLLGMHGGMTPQEMLVPLLAMRLDG